MPRRRPVLLGLAQSHPAHAARLMLEHKGIDHRVVDLMPGLHAPVVRAAGFPGGTVPALRIDGRHVQGSRAIALELDALVPEPPLFPADPVARAAVVAAERWGEEVLQPLPRRLIRWGLVHDHGLRTWMAGDIGLPVPRAAAVTLLPLAVIFARIAGADDDAVRRDLQDLPGHLDHVDALLADGVIGGPDLNAADCQILTSVRFLVGATDLAPLLAGRPCREAALALRPDFPGPMPAFLPAAWLPA